jgi:hypothetical protein
MGGDFVGVAMVLARLKKQPEIHPVPKLLGFAALPVNSITFDQAFQRLIGHEGGYSDDSRDQVIGQAERLEWVL